MERVQHVVAASVLALACTLFTASCLQDPTAAEAESRSAPNSTESVGAARQEAGRGYRSTDFPFVAYVPDDGEGDGGGSQKADKIFHFVERSWGIPVYFWQCRIQIQMAIRSAGEGRITPSRAALYSAEVANAVVDPLLDSRDTWKDQGATFCIQLRDQMNARFRMLHPTAGARVLLNP